MIIPLARRSQSRLLMIRTRSAPRTGRRGTQILPTLPCILPTWPIMTYIRRSLFEPTYCRGASYTHLACFSEASPLEPGGRGYRFAETAAHPRRRRLCDRGCGVSKFPWTYGERETCLVLQVCSSSWAFYPAPRLELGRVILLFLRIRHLRVRRL